jgi:hypothetical protein
MGTHAELSEAFGPLLEWASAEVPLALGLRERNLGTPLTHLQGVLQSEPCHMFTWEWSSEAWARWMVATIALGAEASDPGALVSTTVIGLPAQLPGAIVGLDAIALGGHLSLLALDLQWYGADPAADSSTPPNPEKRPGAAWLRDLRTALGDRVVDRRVPTFAEQGFSRDAIIVGARQGQSADALAIVLGALPALTTALHQHTSAPTPNSVAAARALAEGWVHEEQQNRRERAALARIFGEAQAEAYLDEVLLVAGR